MLTVRAIGRSMVNLWQTMQTVPDSVSFRNEHTDVWSPVLWNHDTVGKIVTIGRIQYGSNAEHSRLIYRAVMTGHPPPYQSDSLAAIDSSDDPRYAHELRLMPRHALSDQSHWPGSLIFEHTNESIPVRFRGSASHSRE